MSIQGYNRKHEATRGCLGNLLLLLFRKWAKMIRHVMLIFRSQVMGLLWRSWTNCYQGQFWNYGTLWEWSGYRLQRITRRWWYLIGQKTHSYLLLLMIKRHVRRLKLLTFLLTAMEFRFNCHLIHLQQNIFIEYIMLDGVNDEEQHAHQLGRLLDTFEVTVSYIAEHVIGTGSFGVVFEKRQKCPCVLCDQNAPDTVELARRIEKTRVSALAVHGRPREPANWSEIAHVVVALSIPVIANGDVLECQDFQNIRDVTGASSLMVARGAIWNASIFSHEETRFEEVKREYVRKSIIWDHDIKSTKYTLKEMIMHYTSLELPERKGRD
ncbi:hypothetical protein LXL04_007488 [Taraxacum kok-saghyz]